MTSYFDNTYLTDLKVGDKVVEHSKITGLRYVSEVTSISNGIIVVARGGNKQDLHSYGVNSGMIQYPYGTNIPDFYLLKYISPSAPTPFNPGPVSSDAESLIPDYGWDANPDKKS